MSDQRSEVVIGLAGILAVAGGSFIAIGSGQASQTHHMWTNIWFGSGLLLVTLALAIGIRAYVIVRGGKTPTAIVDSQLSAPTVSSGDTAPEASRALLERTFTDASVDDLVKLFQSHNSMQANRLLEPYLGQWMRVDGKFSDVRDVSGASRFGAVAFIEPTTRDPYVALVFSDPKVVQQRLSVLEPGTRIRAIGQIAKANGRMVQLENCELESVGAK